MEPEANATTLSHLTAGVGRGMHLFTVPHISIVTFPVTSDQMIGGSGLGNFNGVIANQFSIINKMVKSFMDLLFIVGVPRKVLMTFAYDSNFINLRSRGFYFGTQCILFEPAGFRFWAGADRLPLFNRSVGLDFRR